MTQLDMIPTPARDTRCREMTGRCWTRLDEVWGRCARGHGVNPEPGAACEDLRGQTMALDPCRWARAMEDRHAQTE